MANRIKITDDELKRIIDKYLDEVCDGNPQFIKYSELSAYFKHHGYDLSDNYLRRNNFARPYIDTMKSGYEGLNGFVLATYETLDINKLFRENSTEDKLRRAIRERDEYYEKVAISAMNIHEYFNNVVHELNNCKQEIQMLEEENAEMKKKLADANRENATSRERISYLRKMINEYLYEDVAKEILAKPLLVESKGYVKPEVLHASIIDGTTEIHEEDSIKDLFFNFGGENETV